MSDTAIRDQISKTVSENDVVLFMKGTPTFPQCGFSSTVVQGFDYLGVDYGAVNVLEAPAIRQGIKDYNNWPTIPQVFVKGEFETIRGPITIRIERQGIGLVFVNRCAIR